MPSEMTVTGPTPTRRGRRHADRESGPRWEAPRASAPGHQRYVVAVLLAGRGEGSALDGALFRRLRTLLRERVRTTRNLTEIDLWLDSSTGDAHAAYKIALLLRSYASVLRVVVPDRAKGAATLLGVAADEIHLAPAAELGPLDAMLEGHPGGTWLSARDVLRAMDEVSRTALDFALRASEGMRDGGGGLARLDCLDVAVRLAAELHLPLARQLHPVDVVVARNLLDTAARYADVLLSLRDPDRVDEAAERPDVDALVAGYPTRRHVIDIDEARDLGLPVHPLWKYPAADAVTALHEHVEDREASLVEVRASEIDLRAVPPEHEGERPLATVPSAVGAQPPVDIDLDLDADDDDASRRAAERYGYGSGIGG